MTGSITKPPTRQRMIDSAVQLLRERGAAGVTIDAVLTRSEAPRGSVYHHFPGGRNQILTEALQLAGDTIGGIIESATSSGSRRALEQFRNMWAGFLAQSDFNAGCPAVSVAVGGSPEDEALQPMATQIFTRWHSSIAAAMVADGIPEERAAQLATVALATIEGAVILCRVHKTLAPLDDAVAVMSEMVAYAGR
ncbi:TetR/AcrR family transcriptional regulator [Smaragdicoccus niigatensis]|uniref:TetR/AcrR family transcriptional regulator n=1 Tax=Smaragdicoccus niigatensis TaxID=359359 RepID=UPI00058DCDBD|nr:TetR/AcrR family transcriptional regulator [Smaragdicoccus niigatensis]